MQVRVHIKPNSKHREEVIESKAGLAVYVKAPAIEGRANEAARQLLAAHYSVAKSQVELVRGQTSKFKLFKIDR